jgi:ketosteroid isomerase-like protein
MRTIGWVIVIAIGAGACADPQGVQDLQSDTPAAAPALARGAGLDIQAARAALLAADQAFGARLTAPNLTAGVLAGLAANAYLLFPGENLAQGHAAAEAIFGANFDAGSAFVWQPALADVSADGEIGYSFGAFEFTEDAAHVFWGKYISAWRKQSDGRWLIEAFSLSFYRNPAGALPANFPHPLDNGRGPFTPVDVAAEEQALLDVDAAFSQASVDLGQAEAFKRYADPHAIVLGNPDFIIGRKAIFEAREGSEPGTVLSWTPQIAEVGPLGDLGFTIGTYLFTAPGVESNGKYLTIWRKSASGTWRFVQDGGNVNPPPAAQ